MSPEVMKQTPPGIERPATSRRDIAEKAMRKLSQINILTPYLLHRIKVAKEASRNSDWTTDRLKANSRFAKDLLGNNQLLKKVASVAYELKPFDDTLVIPGAHETSEAILRRIRLAKVRIAKGEELAAPAPDQEPVDYELRNYKTAIRMRYEIKVDDNWYQISVKTHKLLSILHEHAGPMPAAEILPLILDPEHSRVRTSGKVSTIVANVNTLLEKIGLRIANAQAQSKNKPGKYYLTRLPEAPADIKSKKVK